MKSKHYLSALLRSCQPSGQKARLARESPRGHCGWSRWKTAAYRPPSPSSTPTTSAPARSGRPSWMPSPRPCRRAGQDRVQHPRRTASTRSTRPLPSGLRMACARSSIAVDHRRLHAAGGQPQHAGRGDNAVLKLKSTARICRGRSCSLSAATTRPCAAWRFTHVPFCAFNLGYFGYLHANHTTIAGNLSGPMPEA